MRYDAIPVLLQRIPQFHGARRIGNDAILMDYEKMTIANMIGFVIKVKS